MRTCFAITLSLVALLACGSAGAQVTDDTPTGDSNSGSMFSNRPTLGGTLSPSSSTLFGKRPGANGQGPGFVGHNNRPTDPTGTMNPNGRHFVGAAQAGKAATADQAGAEGLEGGLAGGRRAAVANAAAGMLGQQGPRNATRFPVTLRVGFDYHPPGATRVSTQLTRRLAESRAIHVVAPIQVEVQGRTAILRGQVATEHDRDVAGQLARLEAGVVEVSNEIVVTGSSPVATPAAAPPTSPSSPR